MTSMVTVGVRPGGAFLAQHPLGGSVSVGVETSVELRQLRYFVAVAEELHFGRAAARLHMSQSPLSRAIRELEHDLGLVLFVRTTRRVELTPAGAVLLDRSRRALAEIDGAIIEARRWRIPTGVCSVSATARSAVRWSAAHRRRAGGCRLRAARAAGGGGDTGVAASGGVHELAAAVVMESPAAAQRHGVRIDTLRDEPLLVALSASHQYAAAPAMPVSAFVAERVLLPPRTARADVQRLVQDRDPRRRVRVGLTMQTMSAPWDRRMLPVARRRGGVPVRRRVDGRR